MKSALTKTPTKMFSKIKRIQINPAHSANKPSPARDQAALFTPRKNTEVESLIKAPTLDEQTKRMLKTYSSSKDRGLVPRLLAAIFDQIKRSNQDVTVSCSQMIFSFDNVFDLLVSPDDANQSSNMMQSLKVKEKECFSKSNSFSPFKAQSLASAEVEGLSCFKVTSELECLNLLRIGERNRLIRLKKLANQAIRQTSLFQIQIHANSMDRQGNYKTAKFNFCNLESCNQVTTQEESDARRLVDLKKLNVSLKSF